MTKEPGVPDKMGVKGLQWLSCLYAPIIKHIGPKNHAKLLDVGTGTGHLIKLIKKKYPNWEYHGIDPSKEVLLIRETDFYAKAGNAENLPYGENTFDYVVSKSSFCYWKDQVKALKEIYRVTKDGGKIIIMDIHKNRFLDWVFLFACKFILKRTEEDAIDFINRAYDMNKLNIALQNAGYIRYRIIKKYLGRYFLLITNKPND